MTTKIFRPLKQSLLLFPLVMTCSMTNLSAQTSCIELQMQNGATTSIKPTLVYSHNPDIKSYDIYLDKKPTPTTLVGNTESWRYQLSNPLSATGTYYYRIAGKDKTGKTICTSEIRSINVVPPPANDEPGNATALTIGGKPIAGTTIGSTTETGNKPLPGDVFYSFIANKTDIRILPVDKKGNYIPYYKIYDSNPDGSIGSWIYSNTINIGASSDNMIIKEERTPVTGGLTIGRKYYIQIDNANGNENSGLDFSIAIKNVQQKPECGGVRVDYDEKEKRYTAFISANAYANRISSYKIYLSKSSENIIQPDNLMVTHSPEISYSSDGEPVDKIPLSAIFEEGKTYYWAYVGENSVGSTSSCGVKSFTVQKTSKLTEAPANIYPNPATDVINVNAKDVTEDLQLTIQDSRGRVVKTQTILKLKYTNTNNIPVNINDLVSGNYFLNLKGNKTSYSTKFIKK